MELVHLFKPVNIKPYAIPGLPVNERLAMSVTRLHDLKDENLSEFSAAILGIDEATNSPNNHGCVLSPNFIRTYLFGLKRNSRSIRILDLGNVLGNTVNDKFFAVQEAISFLSQKDIPVLVLGGSQDFSVPVVKGLNKEEIPLNLTFIDSMVDLIESSEDFSSQNYLNNILPGKGLNVKNIGFLGLQKYFLSDSQLELVKQRWSDAFRLGELRDGNIKEAEPIIRDAHFVSMDVAAIRHSDMPAQLFPSPNGFSAFEACQMSWYAGMSDNCQVFGLFELNPEMDPSHAGVSLASQIVWFYLEGIAFRINDFPKRDIETYTVFHIENEGNEYAFRFFNNALNGRWWIELNLDGTKFIRACSESDYLLAKQNEIPERWWKYFFVSE
jgi:arginase family enzyme